MPGAGSLAKAVVSYHLALQVVPTEFSWHEVVGDAWYPGWLGPDSSQRSVPLLADPLSAAPTGVPADYDTMGPHVEASLLVFTLVALYRAPGVRAPTPAMFVLPAVMSRFSELIICGKSFLSVASRSIGVGDVEVNVPAGPCPGIVQYFISVDVCVHVDGLGHPCLLSDPLYVETLEQTLTLARMRWYQSAPLDPGKPSYPRWTNRFESEKLTRRRHGPVTGVAKHAQYAFVPVHRLRNIFVKLTCSEGLHFAVGRVPQVASY
jgi:hypothetical protein